MPIPNPFDNVPLNTQRTYVQAKTHSKSGCIIYMPVDTRDQAVAKEAQTMLQIYLDIQSDSSVFELPPSLA